MRRRGFGRDERGLSTMEFVIASPLIFAAMFLGIEVALAVYELKALDKAAQLGARIAVVRDPPVTGLPANLRNAKSAGGLFGLRCSDDNCDPWPGGATLTCSNGAGACDAAAFDYLVGEMDKVHPGIAEGVADGSTTVTVTYTDIELGYAGGPVIPAVTVTITRTPDPDTSSAFTLGGLSALRSLFGGAGSIIGAGDLVVRASYTGEDLCSGPTPPGCPVPAAEP
jgi:Flp pilus assembly protein TadG